MKYFDTNNSKVCTSSSFVKALFQNTIVKLCLLPLSDYLRESLPKTGPLRFASENQFPLNFAHEYILVQK